MKQLIMLVALWITNVGLANAYCEGQTLLGFEEATFVSGVDVLNGDVQSSAHSLRLQLGQPLTQIDLFVTPNTHFALFRVTSTNELMLMTSSADHVCFYQVPTQEPIRFGHELS